MKSLATCLCVLALVPLTLFAASPNTLVVNSAIVDSSTNQITITGQNFGNTTPTVKLAGVQLNVSSFSANTQTIVAVLPAQLSPGTYLLTVSAGSSTNQTTEFDVTLIAPFAVPFSGDANVPLHPVFQVTDTANDGIGILGASDGAGRGVVGNCDGGTGVLGISSNFAVVGSASNGGTAIAGVVLGNGLAGKFDGDVEVTGNLAKGGGSFKIDHPLDPENKYLYHSFVESPDMMNVYNGNVVMDSNGEAVVELPEWFEALNRDFRYQLTSIGAFSPVYIAEKIAGNRFRIAGGKPGMEVSWQVTGIRHDRYAEAHRIPVEQEKPAADRGYYLHPDLFGQPADRSINRGLEAAVAMRQRR